jgi:hypothetical protein
MIPTTALLPSRRSTGSRGTAGPGDLRTIVAAVAVAVAVAWRATAASPGDAAAAGIGVTTTAGKCDDAGMGLAQVVCLKVSCASLRMERTPLIGAVGGTATGTDAGGHAVTAAGGCVHDVLGLRIVGMASLMTAWTPMPRQMVSPSFAHVGERVGAGFEDHVHVFVVKHGTGDLCRYTIMGCPRESSAHTLPLEAGAHTTAPSGQRG